MKLEIDTEDYILDFVDQINYAAESFITENCELVTADKIGLDARAGRVWVGKDFIAAVSSRSLDYYGGFEYVDQDDISYLGKYKIYHDTSSRVCDCLNKRD